MSTTGTNIEQILYRAYLQGKEKQHKDVKSCVGFLQLTNNLLDFISNNNDDSKRGYTYKILVQWF